MASLILSEIRTFWKTYVILFTPFILLPLPLLVPGTEAACGYGVLLMGVYWVTEALPIAVTALMPIFLFPLLGISQSKEITLQYGTEIVFTAMGGLVMALSVEKSNLHKRVALKVLGVMGPKPRWLLLGFMLPTWFLSMWISNTATAAMMIPVAESVLQQFKISLNKKSDKGHKNTGTKSDALTKETTAIKGVVNNGYVAEAIEETSFNKSDMNEIDTVVVTNEYFVKSEYDDIAKSDLDTSTRTKDLESVESNLEEGLVYQVMPNAETCDEDQTVDPRAEQRYRDICKMLSLAIAYSANTGGTATLTGTGPNMILSGQAQQIYGGHGLISPITWGSWLAIGLPNATLCLIVAWLWLQLYFLGIGVFCFCCNKAEHDPEAEKNVRTIVKQEYENLGPMSFEEYACLGFFIALILLWFTRDPGFVKGYAALFPEGYIGDSVPAMFITVCLFFFPESRPQSAIFCKPKNAPTENVPPLLSWSHVSRNLAWGPILVLGGGFAMADAVMQSGLSQTIADAMSVFQPLPPWVITMLICILVSFLTEFTSNSATTTLILPILSSLAEALGLNPLYLMIPATLAASLAFMLPVATPPNAIIFSYGHIVVFDMVKVGIMMNILCILIVVLGANTWITAIFDLKTVPWATNSTSAFNQTLA